jgi:hypothetical protein
MSRTTTLTLGFLLLMLGLKLNFVETYQLTPTATRFWIERIEDPNVVAQNSLQQYLPANQFNRPIYQTGYAAPNAIENALTPQKQIKPPTWICWPVFFLGAFLLLNGLTMKNNS